MRVDIVSKNRDLIFSFELESNPFSIGEILNVSDANNLFNGKLVASKYKIENIEHSIGSFYSLNFNYILTITVSEIK